MSDITNEKQKVHLDLKQQHLLQQDSLLSILAPNFPFAPVNPNLTAFSSSFCKEYFLVAIKVITPESVHTRIQE